MKLKKLSECKEGNASHPLIQMKIRDIVIDFVSFYSIVGVQMSERHLRQCFGESQKEKKCGCYRTTEGARRMRGVNEPGFSALLQTGAVVVSW